MTDATTLAATIRDRAGDAPVELGLILGSGLGHLADAVEGTAIPYADLVGFPQPGVSGHNPKLVIGDLLGTRVAIFGARAHYYEHGDAAAMRMPLAVLKELGAKRLRFRQRWAVLSAARIYGAIGRKVLARGQLAWETRTRVNGLEKTGHIVAALFEAIRNRPQGPGEPILWSRHDYKPVAGW